jgi:hypothetical protein
MTTQQNYAEYCPISFIHDANFYFISCDFDWVKILGLVLAFYSSISTLPVKHIAGCVCLYQAQYPALNKCLTKCAVNLLLIWKIQSSNQPRKWLS